jgi:hypothetical protein
MGLDLSQFGIARHQESAGREDCPTGIVFVRNSHPQY